MITGFQREELTHYFRPKGPHRQLFLDRSREILMAGPAGTGKTRACLEKVHFCALRYPGSHFLLVRKTLESLKSSALVIFQEEVIAEDLASGDITVFGGSRFRPPQFTYSNGSMIIVGGMDKPEKVMSSQYDLIHVNEATELDEVDWESLTTRMRHGVMPWQQIIGCCNPAEQTHWLKQRCDSGRTKMYNTLHQDNPIYFNDDQTPTDMGREYVYGVLGNLSGITRLRLLDGQWVSAEGMIYTEFDPAVHIVDRFEIPKDSQGRDLWPHYWTVDFGVVNPFCWQDWVQDPDGNLYLVREIYMTGRTVEDHCRVIKGLTEGQNRPQKIIVDHQAQERMIMEKELRIRLTLAKKDVLPGIQAFQMRLKKRRIFFMRGSLVERDQSLVQRSLPYETVQEIPGYVWLEPDAPKEGPVKMNDHGCDAGRYLVAELDLRELKLGH